ncbi:VOC family protein [Candidatus Enterococcus willemsii]|uniref:Ring-cleaving dioxygenase n=1 Tax=Candidatus Enterococcus willemsii TaxID=1857215 RepID=A0ABQ6YXN4_9ENTE|nr:VOC family protein [Enterococcus sp. CU12B]KAF1302240.1 ring-cleaving dioxygenase [Enterococcus sp. CU12B]
MQPITAIHHISAIVGDPQETLDFYRTVLNLRFVKQTVNFDDEHSYHLYFANQSIDDGTLLTFFNWKNAYQGRVGSGQVGTIAFRVPKGSFAYWKARFTQHQVAFTESQLFQQPTIEFGDVHQLALALVESDEVAASPEILGFHGAVLLSSYPKATAQTLTKDLGLTHLAETDTHNYFQTVGDVHHQIVLPKTPLPKGRWGIGTVHHIAWSVPTDEEQFAWQTYLSTQRYRVTEIKDRKYFKALYFPEFGDVMFEMATKQPGLTVDEAFDELGTHFVLPAHFESRRAEIVANLPELIL